MAGSNADNKLENSKAASQQAANLQAVSDPQTQAAIQKYLSNGGDIKGALSGVKQTKPTYTNDKAQKYADEVAKGQYGGDTLRQVQDYINSHTTDQNQANDELTAAVRNQLISDPETASLISAQQIQSNPLSAGMFGKGGIQDQRQADETNLTKTAYDWNAQDESAFGTAAAGINRQYGAEQGNLARALSSRGFGSADSGVAQSQFSGLQGNTSDRLAAAQQGLANNRMQVGLQRLTAARNAVNSAQGMAQGAMNDQFNRNMVGIGRGDKQVANSWGQAQDMQHQANTEFDQQQASSVNPAKILGGAVTGAVSTAGGNVLGQALGYKPPTK